jgi:hypothetical protein
MAGAALGDVEVEQALERGRGAAGRDLADQASGPDHVQRSRLHGALVAGVVLAAAGVFGLLFNATRDNVKTSR